MDNIYIYIKVNYFNGHSFKIFFNFLSFNKRFLLQHIPFSIGK